MRALRAKLIPVAVACGMTGGLAAQESEAPDLSFLEFLGSWEEGDDEWFVVAGLVDDEFGTLADEGVLEAEEADGPANADETDETDESDDEQAVDAGDTDDGERTDEAETTDAD